MLTLIININQAGEPTNSNKMEKLITKAEAAKLFKVTTRTLYNWEQKGIITPLKAKGLQSVRYSEKQIQNLFKKQDNE